MPPCPSAFAPVRKEVRRVGVCAPAHIVDGLVGDPEVSHLKSDQRGQVAMRPSAAAIDDHTAGRSLLHRGSHFLADLERLDPDVGAYGNNELGWIVAKRFDRSRNDPRDRAAPTGMRRANVPTRRVGDQDGHAIGRTRSNGHPFDARDEAVSLQVGNGLGDVGADDLTYAIPMHLPLLEEAIGGNAENLGEARSVLAHRVVVIAEMKTEVQRVVRRAARPSRTRCKRMAEAMPLQKPGMPRAHSVLCSMVVL
jgi:hypothetical protein